MINHQTKDQIQLNVKNLSFFLRNLNAYNIVRFFQNLAIDILTEKKHLN